MKNKAQIGGLGLAIITAIIILIIGLAITNFVLPEISVARGELSCASASTISDGNKLLCLAIDLAGVYWIYIIIALLVGIIVSRFAL